MNECRLTRNLYCTMYMITHALFWKQYHNKDYSQTTAKTWSDKHLEHSLCIQRDGRERRISQVNNHSNTLLLARQRCDMNKLIIYSLKTQLFLTKWRLEIPSRGINADTSTRWKKKLKCRNKLELYTRIQRWYEVTSYYGSQSPLLISEGVLTPHVLWRSVSHALLQHFRPYPFPPSFSSRFCMIEFSTCSS